MKRAHACIALFLFTPMLLVACNSSPARESRASSSSAATGESSTSSSANVSDTIHVSEPKPNALVRSPLTVRGQARGSWFFEASFPVKLLDAHGREIASTHVNANGNWMTENFVPFAAQLAFQTTSPTGTLVLEKDNPSGLPEHAASVHIPVRFGK